MCWFHDWEVVKHPVEHHDLLQIEIEHPELEYFYINLTSLKRTCKKCGRVEIYEPPEVCGGDKYRWCEALISEY